MFNGLDQLVMASSLTDMLKELQEGIRALHEDVNRLKTNGPTLPPRKLSTVTPQHSKQDSTQRIPGMNWAEEMDILDPILDDEPGDKARIVEVSPHTGTCITVSFRSMANSVRRTLRSKFILLKVPVTCAPRLDKVYADLCSKSTKQSDKSLAWIQALMLDAVEQSRRPWSSSTLLWIANLRRLNWTWGS